MKTDKKKTNDIDKLTTEELEQELRTRYGISENNQEDVAKSTPTNSGNTAVDTIANNVFGIIIAVVAIGILFLFLMAMSNSSYNGSSSSSSSGKTDWSAYCRDMFPDNDEYSKAAREGCINGGETTDNLIDGKYNK